MKQDIQLCVKWYKNYHCGMCKMSNSDIGILDKLEGPVLNFGKLNCILSPPIWTTWISDNCVCVWVLSAANWTGWVVTIVFVCAVHMASSRRSHGSCITHTSTTGLTMTRRDPGVTYSWKRGKRKVNSLFCCQVEITYLWMISCYLLPFLCRITG